MLVVLLALISCTPVDLAEKTWHFSSVGLFSSSLSPDGKYSLYATIDKGVAFQNLETNQIKFRFTHGIDPLTKQTKTITHVAMAESIAATALPGEIGIWDLKTGQSLRYWALPYKDRQILSLSLSEFGKYALIGFTGTKAILINLISGKTIREFEHADSVSTVSLSHQGQFALIGSDDFSVRLWDLTTGKLAQQWFMKSAVQYATFSPDDKFILVSQNLGPGKIFSVQTGKVITQLSNQFGHDFTLGSNSLLSAIFLNNNRYIAAGCPPRYIRIFEVRTGKLIKQFNLTKKNLWLTGPAPIIALAMNKKNQLIAQSSNGLGYLYTLDNITLHTVNTE